jgi:predicted kinase
MKKANYALWTALVLTLVAGSAYAGEQHVASKTVPQPTVMSDEELDQIVGAGAATSNQVAINRTNAWDKSGHSKATQNGSFWVINDNPSP